VALKLTDAQLDEAARHIFLLRGEPPLPKPVDTGGDFAKRFAGIAANPRFSGLGIGVIDFQNVANPRIWLHNPDDIWRVGSVSKLSIALAAVQLRDDVDRLNASSLGPLLMQGNNFDQLFAMPQLWRRFSGRSPDPRMLVRIGSPETAPRVSTLLNLDAPTVDFADRDPRRTDDELMAELRTHSGGHVQRSTVAKFSIRELLWLTLARSDDMAAWGMLSLLGVPYVRSVMRAYGLFDPDRGMVLSLGGPTGGEDPTWAAVWARKTTQQGETFRPLKPIEKFGTVRDLTQINRAGDYIDARSWLPGSVSGMAAYMIALMQDRLVDPAPSPASARGTAGSLTIRSMLGSKYALSSYVPPGVMDVVPPPNVIWRMSKVGILGRADGERSGLLSEFLEFELEDGPPVARKLRFAILVTGLFDAVVPTPADSGAVTARLLGTAIHLTMQVTP
jgi:hypothetical protein